MKKNMVMASATFGSLFLVAIAGCDFSAAPTQQQKPDRGLIVATTVSSTITSGNIGTLDVMDNTAYKNLLSMHTDTRVATYNGSIYVLEKYGKDNVLKIHGSVICKDSISYETNIGQAVNISEIAFVSDEKAYITQNMDSDLVVFNPATGTIIKRISLARFNTYAGTDSAVPIPYMYNARIHGEKLYVSCERLKKDPGSYDLLPSDTSLIAIVSVATDTIIGCIKLIKKNPFDMDIIGNKMYVVCTGSYNDSTDGSIECIDLATDKNTGIVALETPFKGSISGITVVSETKAFIAVVKEAKSFTNYHTAIVDLNLITGEIGQEVQGIGNAFGGVVFTGAYLYVGDRSDQSPGIVIVDPATNKKVSGPYTVGLPPYSLAYLKMD
jgi:DNA-binding beta-propeller fold protein YncE